MTCLYVFLAVQSGAICYYYLHPNIYVCMYVRMYERLRKQISPIKIVKYVIKNLNNYNKFIVSMIGLTVKVCAISW